MLENQQQKEQDLDRYVTDIDSKLEDDYTKRLNGDGTYVGYTTLRDFYKGKQWSYTPEEGATMRTYNYSFVVVENMTAFLASEKPEIIHEPSKVADPLDRVISEQLTKLLNVVHDYNSLHIQFQKGARIGSMIGDTFIVGPFWDKEKRQITYRVVDKPELVRPIWKTDDFTELAGFIMSYRIDLRVAEKMYAEKMKERGITSLVADPADTHGQPAPTNQSMANVKIYWDDTEFLLKVKGKILDYVEHKSGFVPCQYIPNIQLPGENKGTSDLENLLDAQQQYNIGASGEKDILDAVAYPILWGNNLDNISEIQTGKGTVYNVPEDSVLNAIQITGNPSVVDNYSKDRRADIISLARQNDVVITGSSSVAQMSGRAMAVIMQGVNNSVNLRKPFWQSAFQNLNANILKMMERYLPESKELIRGNYKTSVFITSAYMRSVVDELNKLTHKTQSLESTMKNMGINSPSEEIKIIKEEMKDPILNIELSRQPGLLRTWEQEEQMAKEEAAAPAQPQVAGQPTLTEGENQPGESPAPIPGQRMNTPEGEVNQETQQNTQAPIIEE